MPPLTDRICENIYPWETVTDSGTRPDLEVLKILSKQDRGDSEECWGPPRLAGHTPGGWCVGWSGAVPVCPGSNWSRMLHQAPYHYQPHWRHISRYHTIINVRTTILLRPWLLPLEKNKSRRHLLLIVLILNYIPTHKSSIGYHWKILHCELFWT